MPSTHDWFTWVPSIDSVKLASGVGRAHAFNTSHDDDLGPDYEAKVSADAPMLNGSQIIIMNPQGGHRRDDQDIGEHHHERLRPGT